jgi:predicted transcriptional regulator
MTEDLRIQELTKDIIVANIQGHNVPNDQLQAMIRETIASLKPKAEIEDETQTIQPELTDWRKSIGQQTITCMLCGKTLKSLSVHLRTEHQMSNKVYRQQFSIPAKIALSSKMVSAKRRKIAKESGAGERLKLARQARREKK